MQSVLKRSLTLPGPERPQITSVGVADTRMALLSAIRGLPNTVVEARAKVAADRERELDALFAFQAEPGIDALKLWERAVAFCPHLTDDDIAMVVNCGPYIAVNPHLRAAIITGSEAVADSNGIRHQLFTLELSLGSGAMGEVRVVAFLFNGVPHEAVVKLPLFNVLPTDRSDPAFDDKLRAAEKDNVYREKMYLLEACNAQYYWRDVDGHVAAIPHVVTPYMVAHFLDRGTTGVVYEKIVCPWGYVLALDHMSAFDPKATQYPRFHISKQLEVLAGAFDGLNHLHARGLAHMDFKPSQVLVDQNGQGKVTDIGSMIGAYEVLEIGKDVETGKAALYRQMQIDDGGIESIGLPTTPDYYDTDLVAVLQKAGKPKALADRRAAGITLLQILEDNHFLAPNLRNNVLAAANKSPLATKLGAAYVLPDSLERLLQIVQELMDISIEHQRPLYEIAAEIRILKAQIATELDPLFEQVYAGDGVVCVADF
jgi:serine/threonine protein kinase